MSAPGTKTLPLVRGRRYRFTRLDSCGNPVFGPDGYVVTTGIVTAAFTAVTTATDDIRVTNSNGDTCIFEPGVTSLEGYSAEIALCGMDPDMFNIATGMPVSKDKDGVTTGVIIDVDVDLSSFAFALEIWTGINADDACGQVGDVDYGYILMPYMQGASLGDFTVQNGSIDFTISNAASRKGGSWGEGPYSDVMVHAGDVPGPLLQPLTSSQVLLMDRTKVAPPADAIGGRPLLDPSWTTLISVDGTPDDLIVDFEVTPSIVSGEGVYYEYGDDSYDFITTVPGDSSHTYAKAGTYVVTASANGTVVTTTVTVTEGS